MNRGATRPQKTAIFVAHQIVVDINSRGNTPGDRLPPEKVMLEQYDVGRGTLRESLRFLELQGVILLKPGPGGGPIVRKPDASGLATTLTLLMQFEGAPFRTVAESRAGLEPMMARLAASRMSDARKAELTNNLARMKENIHDLDAFLRHNRDFHVEVAHGSENAIFGCLVDALEDIFDGASVGVDYPERWRHVVLAAHQRIHDAIIAGRPEEAESAMARHIEDYLSYISKKFPEALNAPIVWDGR